MPLLREWSPDPHSLAAIWHTTEDEDYFRGATGLDPAIPSRLRRIEHLAGRFLLRHLREDFPLLHIRPDRHDKPRLPEDQYLFSISHSYPYVAAVVADKIAATPELFPPSTTSRNIAGDIGLRECGIDIQVVRPGMERLAHKFLSYEEQTMFGMDDRSLTLAWCAKEAAYKWQGRRGIDFIADMPVSSFENGEITLTLVQIAKTVRLSTLLEDDFAMAVVMNS